SADVRLTAELPAQVHEFMCAEVVIFSHLSPVRIDHGRAQIAWANPIPPMIFIRKAAARPAKDWHVDLFEGGYYVISDAACIGNRTILANPKAFVNAMPKMLRELAVQIAADRVFGLVGMDDQFARQRRCAFRILCGQAD